MIPKPIKGQPPPSRAGRRDGTFSLLRQALAKRKRLARKATRLHGLAVGWLDGVLIFQINRVPVPDIPEVLAPGQERTAEELAAATQRGISVPELRRQRAIEAQRIKQIQEEAAREQRRREEQERSWRQPLFGRRTWGNRNY